MSETFLRHFPRDTWQHPAGNGVTVERLHHPGLREFFEALGGGSFRGGLYRTVHPSELDRWQERVHLAYPQFEGRVTCFGYDWLGNVFALDSRRSEGGEAGVVMFEPGTGEVLDIPANLHSFHGAELLEYEEAAFAISFYEKWRASGGGAPDYYQCAGYRRPMFLGGSDEIENLELSDLDVYWHLTGQLIRKASGVPLGTQVVLR